MVQCIQKIIIYLFQHTSFYWGGCIAPASNWRLLPPNNCECQLFRWLLVLYKSVYWPFIQMQSKYHWFSQLLEFHVAILPLYMKLTEALPLSYYRVVKLIWGGKGWVSESGEGREKCMKESNDSWCWLEMEILLSHYHGNRYRVSSTQLKLWMFSVPKLHDKLIVNLSVNCLCSL